MERPAGEQDDGALGANLSVDTGAERVKSAPKAGNPRNLDLTF
jgi:hypothetical protein